MVIYATLAPISQFFLIKPRFFHFFACEGGFFCYIHIIASNGANANRPKGQTKEREPMTQSKKLHFVSAITQETTTSKSEERFYYVNRKNNKVKHEGVPMRVMAGELGIIAEHLYANRHALTCNQDSE